MDIIDQALESSHDKGEDSPHSDDTGLAGETNEEQAAAIASVAANQGALTLDPNVQYQFRADGAQGQVTYRVVQVSQDGQEATAQVVTTSAFPTSQVAQRGDDRKKEQTKRLNFYVLMIFFTHQHVQIEPICLFILLDAVAKAVIQSPFTNGGSPTPDSQAEQRFAYFAGSGEPTVTPGVEAAVGGATAIGPVTAGGAGQFYVMMSPQDVLQGQRNIAPRTTFSPKLDGGRSTRDDRRRATHNEVERRRRDKINNWIVQLSKQVPDCAQEHTKSGQVSASSKGGILAKACDYIQDLRSNIQRLQESLKDTERITLDAELLRQQCEELKQENHLLRAQLQQHGIVPQDIGNHT